MLGGAVVGVGLRDLKALALFGLAVGIAEEGKNSAKEKKGKKVNSGRAEAKLNG
jgi:hypothetical protein